MILKIIEIIFPVLLISLLGYFYAKKTNIDMTTAIKLNMDIFLPLLVFYSISEKLPSITVLGTFSIGALIVIIGSGLVLYPLTKILKLNSRSFLPPMMLSNSINLGLPITLFAFGEEAMAMMITLALVQVIGQFTIGIAMYGGEVKIMNLLKNPVILAMLAGLLFNYFDLHLAQILLTPTQMLSQVSVPLVLFALGVKLASVDFSHWKVGLVGAILCPLSGIIVALAVISIFDYTPMQISLLILFSALPPAIMNAIMAEYYKHNSSLVTSIVAVGNIFSIIYIPIVLYFLL
jgi:predicted permease